VADDRGLKLKAIFDQFKLTPFGSKARGRQRRDRVPEEQADAKVPARGARKSQVRRQLATAKCRNFGSLALSLSC
jgi:hypothetical protein